MRRCVLVLLLSSLLPSAALADRDVTLEVTLLKPSSSTAYVNQERCDDDQPLRMTWTLPEFEQTYVWDNDQPADVFFSTSSACDKGSGAIEVGDEEDLTVVVGLTTGNYPEEDLDALTVSDLGLACDPPSEQEYYFCIEWQDDVVTNPLIGTTETLTWTGGALMRFDTQAPTPPVLDEVLAGDTNLKLSWSLGNEDEDDIGEFTVSWCPEEADGDCSCASPSTTTVTGEESRGETITGLENGTPYCVWVQARDKYDNLGAESNVLTGTPQPVDDFYEYYKRRGGTEEGGFCFVATAAWGSYYAGMVQPLRAFRDTTLAASETGRSLVSSYYRYGPRWARAVRGSDLHRTVARWSLAPAVAFAQVSNSLGFTETLLLIAGLILLVWLGVRGARRLRGVARRMAPLLVLAALVAGFSAPALAAEEDPTAGLPDFQLQLRFGPYYPDVDAEAYPGLPDDQEKPFQRIYGGGSELLFEAGLDYEIWHGFGTVMAGASFGFVQFIGKGLLVTENDQGEIVSISKGSDTTVFNIIPLRLTAGYHFDLLATELEIPLVPYVAGGLSYYIWWVTDGVGDTSSWTDENGDSRDAVGGIFGLHFSVGMKLLLDWLDQKAAANLQDEVGVMNTYFFGEFSLSWVNGFDSGDHMDLSDQTFTLGLMMEF